SCQVLRTAPSTRSSTWRCRWRTRAARMSGWSSGRTSGKWCWWRERYPAGDSNPVRRRIAFVVQRCGIEVNGGAELHCRLVAERLGRAHDVEVLTTCAVDYMTWANHYPPGEQKIGELRIRRFPVERTRDVDAFNRLSAAIHPRIATAPIDEQERWMREQGPWAPALF